MGGAHRRQCHGFSALSGNAKLLQPRKLVAFGGGRQEGRLPLLNHGDLQSTHHQINVVAKTVPVCRADNILMSLPVAEPQRTLLH